MNGVRSLQVLETPVGVHVPHMPLPASHVPVLAAAVGAPVVLRSVSFPPGDVESLMEEGIKI